MIVLQTDRLPHQPEETTVRHALALTAASLVLLAACGSSDPAESLVDHASETTAPAPTATPTPGATPATSEPAPVVTTAPAATEPPPPAVATTAPAAPSETTYANCTEMNTEHPHGVGRPGAVDQSSGGKVPVTTFEVNEPLYEANRKSDRDDDGIACEKA